jgi:hypothetical protein
VFGQQNSTTNCVARWAVVLIVGQVPLSQSQQGAQVLVMHREGWKPKRSYISNHTATRLLRYTYSNLVRISLGIIAMS